MGLPTVAVYSDCDRDARHVREADQAIHIGPSEAAQSYLGSTRSSTRRAGPAPTRCIPATASWPRTPLSRARARRRPDLHRPVARRDRADGQQDGGARPPRSAAGVPVVPGTEQPFDAARPDDEIARIADGIGYPLVVKAVAGGGGKGCGSSTSRASSLGAVRTARSEAGSAFGDTSIYLERRIVAPAAHRDPAARRPSTAR